MKDFKCRIYEHKTGKMQYSSESLALTLDGNLMQCEINDQEGMFVKKESYEMLLFIGLKDKNDKEIYEGDIVRFEMEWDYTGENKGKVSKYHTFEVKLRIDDDSGHMRWADIYNHFAYTECEVMGNIYQNPELI